MAADHAAPRTAAPQQATLQHPAVRLLRGESLPELGTGPVEVLVREVYDVLEVEAVVYRGDAPGAPVARRVVWRLDGASVERLLG